MKFEAKKDTYGGSYYDINDDIFSIIPERHFYGSEEDAMQLRILGIIAHEGRINIDDLLKFICNINGSVHHEIGESVISEVNKLKLDHTSMMRLHTAYQNSKRIIEYFIPQCIALKRMYHSLADPSDDQIVDIVSFCVSEEFVTLIKNFCDDDLFLPYRNYILCVYHDIVTNVADILVEKELIPQKLGEDLCQLVVDLVHLQGYDYVYENSRRLIQIGKESKFSATNDDVISHLKKIKDLL